MLADAEQGDSPIVTKEPNAMATTHAASVFTHSCLATPRDPVTMLPSDRLDQIRTTSLESPQDRGRSRSPINPTASSSPSVRRPNTTGGLTSSGLTKRIVAEERPRDESFQASLATDTPYIRPATVSSARPRHVSASLDSRRANNGLSSSFTHRDPSTVDGNVRQSAARDESYASLFATLLESNSLLRGKIQKLKEENLKNIAGVKQPCTHCGQAGATNQHRTRSQSLKDIRSCSKTAPEKVQVHVPNADRSFLSDDSDGHLMPGLPPELLENTWVESSSSADEDEDQRPSCMASSLSQQSLPGSPDDQHEYELMQGQEDEEEEEGEGVESCLTVEEVEPHQIHSETSSDSSRLSCPSSVIHEGEAHSSYSTVSQYSDSLSSSSSSDSGFRAGRANEGDPFASPGMLTVERMWDDFSVEDYTPRSFREEEEKEGKPRKKEWKPTITIPKPFSMTVRESNSPKRKSRSMIQAERERLEREAVEEAELKKQFRASPLPASTFLPLYELINAKNEHRREEVKMMSKEILKATERPFNLVKRENEKKLMKEEAMRRSQILEKLKQKETMFHANPVPKHLFDPNVEEALKEKEEYREIRIKLRAEDLLASSKLPGNMQMKGRGYSVGALRKKRLEENQNKAFLTEEHKFHPSVTDSMPDYDRAYMEFQKQLAQRKKSKRTTATEPFYLRTELIPSRREQVLQDIERDEVLQAQNRWPFNAPRVKVSTKSPKHWRSKSGGMPYPTQLTKTAKVRFSLTQDKLTSEMEREQAKEKQQRERKEKQDNLKKTVAQKTLSHDPTPWLEERKQRKYQQFR